MVPLLVAFAHFAAQEASLRGTVVSAETGLPLAYSIVTRHPSSETQFTDARGAFAFQGTPGTYLLSVRHVGYTPLDTQVVVREDSAPVFRVALRGLAIELPPVTVAPTVCNDPGAPDSSDRALWEVFNQLQENARRYELLAKSYPFQYVLELSDRIVSQRGDTGHPEVRKLRFSSSDNRPYARGRVVEPAYGPWGNPATTLVIRSAELSDLGNADFIEHHCFQLAGIDTLGGDALVRIDFEPATHIRTADMAGSAYLDPITYELRYTRTALTRPERSALRGVRSMTFLTRFRNIAPGVVLQDSLASVTTYWYGWQRAAIGTQRTFDVRFTRKAPPLVP